MVAVQTSFTPKQRLIIDGAFEIAERTLEEVLRPRGEVFVIDADQPGAEALEALAASGHSRAPVGANGNLDEVIGVVHLRDLLHLGARPAGDAVSEIRAFPETAGVLDVLHQMQQSHAQLAVVVDEHGAGAGIVTVEDLVEELVGEIYDETDRDVRSVQHDDDGSMVLPGQFPIHDLPDVGIHDVEDGPYTTIAGLILDRLGRLPDGPGDQVHLAEWVLEVGTVHRHAITQVRATPRGADDMTADPSEDHR